jgi:anhydro-N-acetylmuramic acid kinase
MYVIGLMSGTSIDAIDAVLAEITVADDSYAIRQIAFTMCPFDESLRERVRRLMPPHAGSTEAVCEVNVLLGDAFAAAARAVCERARVALDAIDLIASHGQTVYHQIATGAVRSTLQLGAPAIIAERTGATVIADFRLRDMAAGGEGAPLVPYLDALLFADNHCSRAIQNIGGIGNVTYVPAAGSAIAFDTGPGNVLIDEAVRQLTRDESTFDRDGQIAAAGTVDESLLARWMSHPFFAARPPKSTGRELWGPSEAGRYIAEGRQHGLAPADIVATLTALTARSIADAYRRFLGPVDDALIGGGGARNPTLMRMIAAELPESRVGVVDDYGLSADAKEAIAFALMGFATLHGWPSNVPAATGATREVVLGSLTPGANYRALLEAVRQAPVAPPRHARMALDN